MVSSQLKRTTTLTSILEIDCEKSYYNPLLATDAKDEENTTSTSGISTESSSTPPESCNVMRRSVNCEDLLHPVLNSNDLVMSDH